MAELRKIERTQSDKGTLVDSFLRWRRDSRCDLVCFDVDDSLCVTSPVFDKAIKDCARLLEKSRGRDYKYWKDRIVAANNAAYESRKVNPNRWHEVVKEVIGVDKGTLYDEMINIFYEIYTTPLEYTEGTESFLQDLKDSGTQMAIVTHANEKWHEEKYQEWLKLWKYIPPDKVYVVGEDVHKTDDSWKEAIAKFKSEPKKVLGAGDSPRSDINPLTRIGVKNCVLINKGGVKWEVQQQEVPNYVWEARLAADILYLGEEINTRKVLAS